jgi:hypothetical protein
MVGGNKDRYTMLHTESVLHRVPVVRDMLLDDDFRLIAGYFSVDNQGQRHAIGTAFFLSLWEGEIPHARYTAYCVTARHLFQKHHSRFYIRARDLPEIVTHRDEWILHPETDIAICPLTDFESGRTVELSSRPSDRISFGHNVFMVGLFDPLQDHTAEVELVARFGHIALPDVIVSLSLEDQREELTPARVRLIETRSWGGESGSPVFVHSEYYQRHASSHGFPSKYGGYDMGGATQSDVHARETNYKLLGLLHGHFEVGRPSSDQRVVDRNAGIAAVIPTEEIWDFLMSDERLVKDRKQRPKRQLNAPIPDSTDPRTNSHKKDT